MNQDQPRHIVASGYDRVGEEYTALESAVAWPRMRWVEEVVTRLPDGSRVLDLGCGNGVPATARIAESHHATGVDVSARQIELARANVPAAEFVVGDALELRYAPGSFDAVVACYTFDHLPRERLNEMFALVHEWLADAGWFLFSVETGDEPGLVGQWLGVPMFFSSYAPEETRRLVAGAGFDIVRESIDEQVEGETTVSYLWILARKGV